MKRTLIILLTLFSALNLKSQDTLKAKTGSFSTELNVNLFQGELSFNNSVNQVKLRFFDRNDRCYRFGFMFNTESQNETSEYIYNTTPREYNYKSNIYELALSLGREKHFNGTRRLSPFIGFDITFTDSWTKYIDEDEYMKLTYTNVILKTDMVETSQGYYSTTSIGNRANYSFGLNFLTGFDFYISKHLYLGYEFNLGGKYTVYKKMELDKEIKSTSSSSYYPSLTIPDESSANEFNFGPSLMNGIRVGYIF
ncbi:MAG: hypothetical protein JXB00_12735 [Bacteroidales bacterium]|nr:hypothetical protein [Bacteroidales bacterium]